MDIVFVHLPLGHQSDRSFDPETFLRMARMLGMFAVGRAADGGPLQEPAVPGCPGL